MKTVVKLGHASPELWPTWFLVSGRYDFLSFN